MPIIDDVISVSDDAHRRRRKPFFFALLSCCNARRVAPSVASLARGPRCRVRWQLGTQPQTGDFDELRERSLLRARDWLIDRGDPEPVLASMDTFWDILQWRGTAEWQLRSGALDSAAHRSVTALDWFTGDCVRMGRLMAPGSKLVSVELDPLYVIATKVGLRCNQLLDLLLCHSPNSYI